MVMARQSSLGLIWWQIAGGDTVSACLACSSRSGTREDCASGPQVFVAVAASTCRSLAWSSALGTVSHDDGAEGAAFDAGTAPRGPRTECTCL
jgi:hypothetical protein